VGRQSRRIIQPGDSPFKVPFWRQAGNQSNRTRLARWPLDLTRSLLLIIVNHMVHCSTVNLDRVAAAISDPTRRAIIDRLARGSARISDVAEPFPMTLTGFCKHVRVLERAGLVRRTRRGRENTLELSPQPLRDMAKWILNYEEFWNARLDRLQEFFTTQKEKSR
jgi:DNA-binding transcriptional ArsR family regulator